MTLITIPRAVEDATLPRYDLAQLVTALRAETRSLREQLHRKEDLLASYRRADEADDAERMTAAPDPEETTP